MYPSTETDNAHDDLAHLVPQIPCGKSKNRSRVIGLFDPLQSLDSCSPWYAASPVLQRRIREVRIDATGCRPRERRPGGIDPRIGHLSNVLQQEPLVAMGKRGRILRDRVIGPTHRRERPTASGPADAPQSRDGRPASSTAVKNSDHGSAAHPPADRRRRSFTRRTAAGRNSTAPAYRPVQRTRQQLRVGPASSRLLRTARGSDRLRSEAEIDREVVRSVRRPLLPDRDELRQRGSATAPQGRSSSAPARSRTAGRSPPRTDRRPHPATPRRAPASTVLVALHHTAVGKDHLGADQTVAGQPVLAAEQPDAAAQASARRCPTVGPHPAGIVRPTACSSA